DDLVDAVVGQLLDDAVAQAPDREAVVVSAGDPALDVRWTYADLGEAADRLAKGLIALGVQAGDRVAIWAPNIAPWLAAEFAIAKAGAVLVTVNPTYRAHEAEYLLEDADVTCCLVMPTFRSADLLGALRSVRDRLPRLRHVVTLVGGDATTGDTLALAELMRLGDERVSPAELARRSAEVRPDAVAQIQYTSGTTGKPKGAMLTHRSIVNNARLTMQRWGIRPEDRWCNPMPFFHTTGCVMMGLGIVIARATHCPVVRFDAATVLRVVAEERCTLVETVPTMLGRLLERHAADPTDTASLRIVGTSGAPVPRTLIERVRAAWDAQVLVLYGLTEASPTITCLAPDDPADRAADTVGRPLPCTEVRVVEPGTARILDRGQAGELQTRGYLTMAGYLNQPDATSAALDADGWLSTGDLATVDDDGYVAIVGRLKDVIIRGGENLYPAEIEDEIRRHPAVLEVCVVGVPDSYFGEEACAVVQLRDAHTLTAEELRTFLLQRVTHQKVPRHLVCVDQFPQTSSGKIQRFRLRERVAGRLDGTEPAPDPQETR
ncbi:MAG: AMP-binding protein, partial [Marmoricola sp.]